MPFMRGLSIVADATANDSDKTLTVPAGTVYEVESLYVRLVSTATVGNRQLTILVTDADDNILLRYLAGGTQAASITMDYNFAPGHPNETGNATNNGAQVRSFMQGLRLPAGYKIRVYDSAAVDAAADDLTIRLLVRAIGA